MTAEGFFADFLKIIPLLSVLATVTGWVVSSKFSSKNTGTHAKNTELNKLIDSLNKALDDIYTEMATVLSSDLDDRKKTAAYHKFIGMIKNVRFICDAIQKLDEAQRVDNGKLFLLRKACTSDQKYDSKKINTALPQLQDIQEEIKRSYIKKFTT
ncbi:hypothetical protein AB6D34_08125 [Pectobacterium brasiliense]|uniref:Uncharacterized protein n=1 Tax=Pectobacterium brasiliense TaxID=180957 RepID=A0A433NIP6_9GAMM|nr:MULTISPECIES: hypothetical protein [Pectobacterium]GKW28020.1 hypothetical protein PEC331060_11980 [Pectobacterium carotovorum subsp. carotovorum]MBN3046751.1 hypothetical protein [Pectobacterium brasiliense]MBN3075115.1 hypothetical protein [Pectobacterium brasiliense]MBN3083758.1 hypothetical protein [Pectobacterium brasiliense]MBN3089298.1 hypothetical protein [Pectobacterium brasiliense]